MIAGRLGGAEIARTEWYREGRVPLHTLRAESITASRKRTPPWDRLESRPGSTRAKSFRLNRLPESAFERRLG